MVTGSVDLEVTGVYAADDNSPANLMGRVSFSYTPSALTPVTVSRSYKPKNSDKYKTIEVAVIHGAAVIQVKGASVWNGDEGPYLACDVSLPRDLRDRVLALALEKLPTTTPNSHSDSGSGRPSPR